MNALKICRWICWGFRLRSLSCALAKEWRLGSLVVAASEPQPNPSDAGGIHCPGISAGARRGSRVGFA